MLGEFHVVLAHSTMCFGVSFMTRCSRYKDVPRHVRCYEMLVCAKALIKGVPRLLRIGRSFSLIELSELDYVLNNIFPTQNSGTLSKWNFLDNKNNRYESCVES